MLLPISKCHLSACEWAWSTNLFGWHYRKQVHKEKLLQTCTKLFLPGLSVWDILVRDTDKNVSKLTEANLSLKSESNCKSVILRWMSTDRSDTLVVNEEWKNSKFCLKFIKHMKSLLKLPQQSCNFVFVPIHVTWCHLKVQGEERNFCPPHYHYFTGHWDNSITYCCWPAKGRRSAELFVWFYC